MIHLLENFDLTRYNTFGVPAKARYYVRIEEENDLLSLLEHPVYESVDSMVLGGGSNVLFTKDYEGLIIHCALHGQQVVHESEDHVHVAGASGILWNDFVQWTLSHNWGGIENLSLIPGTLGAAPIQNIGAYGVELSDVLHEVRTIDLKSGTIGTYTHSDCGFGYRSSIFKKSLKGKIFISSVTLTLTKKSHRLCTGYGSISDTLTQQGIHSPTIHDVSRVVIKIRQSKLPDPSQVGNAGSFFKNPTITYDQYTSLQKDYPKVPGYPIDTQFIKIPAGWLIEQCGWKGKRVNDVGVHAQQALVLVNYKHGRGDEILSLANRIQESVKLQFKIELVPEVNIV